MDFFAHQEKARRNTALLVFFYFAAVGLIICAIYAIFVFVLVFLDKKESQSSVPLNWDMLWNPEMFLWVVGGTFLIIVLGTLYKVSQLSTGGQAVAILLGGRKLDNQTKKADERKILNVVEEMAIASGIPAPPVFMLDKEQGINAFAAGFSTRDAVIGVTAGCVSELSRDELQGVIAHEFSHILTGDMKLNIKLIGILNGILVIAVIGYWLLRSSGRSRSSNGKGGNPLPLIGLLLMVVGYIGVFFGNIIKAAVSRQREFNADSSAVQFTRNPDGISGALKKIGGYVSGSKMMTPKAQEVSHMFFSMGLSGFLSGLFATHPPLKERIKRLNGSFNPEEQIEGASGSTLAPASGVVAGFSGKSIKAKFQLNPEETIAMVGAPTAQNAAFASALLSELPHSLVDAASNAYSARAVIFGLLLDKNKGSKTRQIQESGLKERIEIPLLEKTLKAADEIAGIRQGYRLPLTDMSITPLKNMSAKQYSDFIKTVDFLVHADNKVEIFEFMISRLIHAYLDPAIKLAKSASVKFKTKGPLHHCCADLISCLAYWGSDDAVKAQSAFNKGTSKFNPGKYEMRNRTECSFELLDKSIAAFSASAPLIKRSIIEACVACIAADNLVTIEEAELLRLVSASLDCPIPPFSPNLS